MRGEEEGRQEDGEDSPPAGRSHRVGMIMRALFSVIQLAVEGGKGGKAVGTHPRTSFQTAAAHGSNSKLNKGGPMCAALCAGH